MHFDTHALRWLADLLHGLYAARTVHDFSTLMVGAMHRRFEVAFGSCEEIAAGGYRLHGMTLHRPLPVETAACLHDHPMMPSVRNMPALTQVRSRFSRRQFENTDYFHGVARVVGFDDHLILRVQSRPSSVTVSLCRDRFHRGEVALLRLLQPHLEAVWQRVSSSAMFPRDDLAKPLWLSRDWRPLNLTATQAARLRMYYPHWRQRDGLPEPVVAWVRTCEAELGRRPVGNPLRILSVKAGASVLLFRYFPLESGGAELHLTERFHRVAGQAGWEILSAREREIVRWMVAGKRDVEIGVILGVSPRTVSKHVEHVLAKVGVSRRAAVAAALGV